MSAELGGSQISSLLEALPGIASVLRSPVADALVKAIRAAAGVGEFTLDDAEELVRYAVRRGLIGPDEGDRVLADVEGPLKAKEGRRRRRRRNGRPRRRSRGGESLDPEPPDQPAQLFRRLQQPSGGGRHLLGGGALLLGRRRDLLGARRVRGRAAAHLLRLLL